MILEIIQEKKIFVYKPGHWTFWCTWTVFNSIVQCLVCVCVYMKRLIHIVPSSLVRVYDDVTKEWCIFFLKCDDVNCESFFCSVFCSVCSWEKCECQSKEVFFLHTLYIIDTHKKKRACENWFVMTGMPMTSILSFATKDPWRWLRTFMTFYNVKCDKWLTRMITRRNIILMIKKSIKVNNPLSYSKCWHLFIILLVLFSLHFTHSPHTTIYLYIYCQEYHLNPCHSVSVCTISG